MPPLFLREAIEQSFGFELKLADEIQQVPAVGGQSQWPRRAVEELDADLGFKAPDVLGQSRLADSQKGAGLLPALPSSAMSWNWRRRLGLISANFALDIRQTSVWSPLQPGASLDIAV